MSRGLTIEKVSNGYVLTKTWDRGQDVVISESPYGLASEVYNWFKDEYDGERVILAVPPEIQREVIKFARSLTDEAVW